MESAMVLVAIAASVVTGGTRAIRVDPDGLRGEWRYSLTSWILMLRPQR
jgi:hypothetical protein